MLKNGKTHEQAGRELLRDYLIRCHDSVSAKYPEISNMKPSNAADFLIHLQETGRLNIELFMETSSKMGCRIAELKKVKNTDVTSIV